MKQTQIQPYGPLQELAANLWVRDGEWNGTIFRRRMTICRLKSGDLVVHNAFQLKQKDVDELARLGGVAWILVPNRFHCSEAIFLRECFPAAKVVASPEARRALRKQKCPVHSWLPEGWEPQQEIHAFPIGGTRGLGEWVFLHLQSKSLIVTDLVFHLQEAKRPMDRSFLRMNDIYQCFAPSRIFKLLFTKSEKQLLDSLLPILRSDFDRVIMSHGEIVESGGKKALREGFERRFPKAAVFFQHSL